jgi:hypothetical protein
VAVDETRLRKTGRLIPQAFYQRDPLSPPFHVNLMLGLRFLQASLLVPLYRRAAVSTRALPIAFEEVSPVKRPQRKASREQWRQYRQAAKQHNLSQALVKMITRLRQQLDQVGGARRLLVVAGGWQFCQSHLLWGSGGADRVDRPPAQRCRVVLSGSGRLDSFL